MRLLSRAARQSVAAVASVVLLPFWFATGAHALTEPEPNDTEATATTLLPGISNTVDATIRGEADVDYYTFVAPATGTYLVDTFDVAVELGPLTMYAYDETRMTSFLGAGRPSPTSVASNAIPAEAGARYFVVVSAQPGGGRPVDRQGSYRIRVMPENALGAERGTDGEPDGNHLIGRPIAPGEWVRSDVADPDPRFYRAGRDTDSFVPPELTGAFGTARVLFPDHTAGIVSTPGHLTEWSGREVSVPMSRGWNENWLTVTANQPGPFEVCVESWGTTCSRGVARLAGATRYATAARISSMFPPRVPVAVVATGENYPDALAGAALAGYLGGPVILVPKSGIPADVDAELSRLKPRRIIVVGGEGSVSAETYQSLYSYVPMAGPDGLIRLAGKDRYETAAMVAGWRNHAVEAIYVATGVDFPDAMSGAALAGVDGAPLLLTRPDRLDSHALEQLYRLQPQRIVILGGVSRVSQDVEAHLWSFVRQGGTVTRIAGADRYETSARIASEFPVAPAQAFIATGATFPDALAGAGRGAWTGGPVLLVPGASVPKGVDEQLARLPLKAITVLGGTSVVSQTVEESLGTYLR
ncbi:hypothetical protein GA707_11000 [Nostocoides sp. F2B08]|uniref:cell wall-binding repeat-containing protein n=1 Tax=Nostocoides sp. F2B08 TaxID=2653936 RepID=UPI0012632512|nr:cell wall-binding repeat-containing protein [Tetrasphaera sp. F2B08]KAB7743986.1 hypothetical protein GA707_11000 [Tetrasphaera sp. F2B08]